MEWTGVGVEEEPARVGDVLVDYLTPDNPLLMNRCPCKYSMFTFSYRQVDLCPGEKQSVDRLGSDRTSDCANAAI